MKQLRLRSPKFDDASIEIPFEASQLKRPFSGTVCSQKGDEYRIDQNIVRLDEGVNFSKTPAQHTNFIKATASNYEDVWRTKALSLFTGEAFPFDREKELLLEWVQPEADELVLDAACSTGLYGRFLLAKEPELGVYAVDFSPYMLEEARGRFVDEQKNAFLICANVESLPFWAASFDIAVCGGSLNEFGDPVKALYEIRRTLVPGGRAFFMYLTEAPNYAGRLIQKGVSLSGLSFFSTSDAKNMFERAGFSVKQAQHVGMVGFALVTAR